MPPSQSQLLAVHMESTQLFWDNSIGHKVRPHSPLFQPPPSPPETLERSAEKRGPGDDPPLGWP